MQLFGNVLCFSTVCTFIFLSKPCDYMFLSQPQNFFKASYYICFCVIVYESMIFLKASSGTWHCNHSFRLLSLQIHFIDSNKELKKVIAIGNKSVFKPVMWERRKRLKPLLECIYCKL